MTEKESLKDTIKLGFYRTDTSDGGSILTNGKIIKKYRDFADKYQHFEHGKHGKVIHLLDDLPDEEPWPYVQLTVDFSKPFGKIPNQPLFNIAPPRPIKSENNNKDTSILWKHIENLCGKVDQNTKEWVKDWIADIFQNPNKKPGTALTIRSPEATGKGSFFDILMRKLLGESHLSTSCNIFGERFNGDAKNKLLINLDEGSWDNTKADIGALKKFITDPTFHFEEKGKDRLSLPNNARLVMTTNASWVVKSDGSRRFCMLNPCKEDYCSQEYFKKLFSTIEDDNIVKKFLWELEHRVITHSLNIIPKTEEYYNQEELSYDYYDDWLNEVLNDESILVNGTISLWNEFSENFKKCLPGLAVSSINNLCGVKLTSNKLFRRLKDKISKFGYNLESKVSYEAGLSIRYWEFTKLSKNITDITDITDITQIFPTEKEIITDLESGFVSVNCVISNPTTIITDDFIGTPMKQLSSGAAIVDEIPSKTTEFVTINKLIDGSKTAKDENIETYNSFIFEIDNEDLDTQKERAKKLFDEGIVNRAVYSGGKSIHCRITLSNPPDNKEEYKYIWKKLNETYFENKADSACSNPARLTRMPNAVRSSNGKKQERLHLSNRTLDFDWKDEYERDKLIDKWIYAMDNSKPRLTGISTPEQLLNRNIPIEAKKLLENSFVDGERHKMIPKAIGFLKHCGWSLSDIDSLVKATKIKDGKDYVKNIYNYFKGE
jgi:hypothetical protein